MYEARMFFKSRGEPLDVRLGRLSFGSVRCVIGKTPLLVHIADPVVFEAHALRRGGNLFVSLDGTELGYLGREEVLALWT
jgi:hypothetical protein